MDVPDIHSKGSISNNNTNNNNNGGSSARFEHNMPSDRPTPSSLPSSSSSTKQGDDDAAHSKHRNTGKTHTRFKAVNLCVKDSAKVSSVWEFIHKHLSLPFFDLSLLRDQRSQLQLDKILLYVHTEDYDAFIETIARLKPIFHEPWKSLLDNIVWTLTKNRRQHLQQQRRHKGTQSKTPMYKSNRSRRNDKIAPRHVLTNGVIMPNPHPHHKSKQSHAQQRNNRSTTTHSQHDTAYASTDGTAYTHELTSKHATSTLGRYPIQITSINSGFDYCRTSPWIEALHSCLGNDVMRALWLYASIFVPLMNDNYWQITGPALQGQRIVREDASGSSGVDESPSTSNIGTQAHGSHPLSEKRDANTVPGRAKQDQSRAHEKARSRKRKRLSQPKDTLANESIKDLLPCTPINRRPLFYSQTYTTHVQLPKDHVLNQNNPEDLLHTWTDLYSSSSSANRHKKRRLWRRLGTQAIDMAKSVLHKHSACDYARILDRTCPLPAAYHSIAYTKNDKRHNDNEIATVQPPTFALESLAHAYTPTSQVASFLMSIITRVCPVDMWGTEHNQQQVLHLVRHFVQMQRNERMYNKNLLYGVRLTKIAWMRNSHDHNTSAKMTPSDLDSSRRMYTRFIRWMFEDFIVPLLQTCFYVTETEFSGQQVIYYRKPVWSLFRTLSLQKMVQTKDLQDTPQYAELDGSQALSHLQAPVSCSVGVSRLRWLPKATGVRPIALLCKSERIAISLSCENGTVKPTSSIDTGAASQNSLVVNHVSKEGFRKVWLPHGPPTNSVLRDAFTVLSHEYKQKPDLFGAGLHGLSYFYKRYRDFVDGLKPRKNSVRMYFGCVDIEKCFDNINQEVLLDHISSLLQHDSYVIQQYFGVHPMISQERTCFKRWPRVGSSDDISSFPQMLVETTKATRNCIFQDPASCIMVQKNQLLAIVREHLTRHMVASRGRFDDRFLLQKKGIPQGSVLSTLLCNFYYGKMEKMLLPASLTGSGSGNETGASMDLASRATSFLVRMVDDFMLITTDVSVLNEFLSALNKGNAKLGVAINHDKSKVSHTVRLRSGPDGATDDTTSRKILPDNSTRIAWCGMLLDTRTGEVMIDYSSLQSHNSSQYARWAASNVHHGLREGHQLLTHMTQLVRPRCLPILFDPAINSDRVRIMNFYQLMLWAAVKTVWYLDSLSKVTYVWGNLPYLNRCAHETTEYAYRMQRMRLESAKIPSCHVLSCRLTHWLGWRAFVDVLERSEGFSEWTCSLKATEPCKPQAIDGPRITVRDLRRARKMMNLDFVLGRR
jgi:Telomerase ribonucleoprotein complex - RNA binding domain/Reverse transcriptase (RNA-dependent DNA polymerase)